MSSLKDIMDVDVEPLDMYRRKDAAPQQAFSPPSLVPPSQPASPSPKESQNDDCDEDRPTKRRKSDRSSRLAVASCSSSTTSDQSLSNDDSAKIESMDYQSGFPLPASTYGGVPSSQVSSTESEYGMDRPVKYTPVTGRISRAKKGVPVHTCDVCRPVKTFTRAEHLRRHQLSHQKPAYPCNVEDCERSFHRPDLLARHLQRHDSQAEPLPNSGDLRSRTSSVTSDGVNHLVKIENSTQLSMGMTGERHDSKAKSVTPRANETQIATPLNFNHVAGGFTSVDFSNSGNPNKRSRSVAALPETYDAPAPRNAPPRSRGDNYDISTSSGPSVQSQPALNGIYSESPHSGYHSYPTTPQLHLLQIPKDPSVVPGLSYTHESSPWCSSASSTASTQSEGSRGVPYWSRGEDRVTSATNMSDWPLPMGVVPQWSNTIMAAPPDVSGSGFDSILDHYEGAYTASPRTVSHDPRTMLNITSSVGFYPMEAAVGIPTLSSYKHFAPHTSGSSSQFPTSSIGNERGNKSLLGSPHLGALSINAGSTYLPQTQDLDIYIESYFRHFHQFFPLIHRPTFNRNNDSLLTFSMAAIGTQYHSTVEARTKGSELNKATKRGIELQLNWSTHTMQAILLTEMFTRFRGLRMDVQLSRHFEELYGRLLNSPVRHLPQSINQGQSLCHDTQRRWIEWIDIEARQRLLATCFMFDVHQASYHEQARSKARREVPHNELRLPCPESLWLASSAQEWELEGSDYSNELLHTVEQDISPQGLLDKSPFTQTLLICSFAARLPKRANFTSPNDFDPSAPDVSIQSMTALFPSSPLAHIYLALHHTPLHDLLAVSGDTWVFRLKIKPPSSFHAAQFRLKNWSSSLPAAQATYHACRILSSALSSGFGKAPFATTFDELTAGSLCICDYWSLYISALICWAFGNRYQAVSGPDSQGHSSLVAADADDSSSASTPTDDSRPRALSYVDNMLALSPQEMLTRKASFRGDTAGVIDAVRRRLELENVGNKSSLLVDAIGVLYKIQIGGKFWF